MKFFIRLGLMALIGACALPFSGCSHPADELLEANPELAAGPGRSWQGGFTHSQTQACGCETFDLADAAGRTQTRSGVDFGTVKICNDTLALRLQIQLGRSLQVDSAYLWAGPVGQPQFSATHANFQKIDVPFRNGMEFSMPLAQLPNCQEIALQLRVAQVAGLANTQVQNWYKLSPKTMQGRVKRCNYACCTPAIERSGTTPPPHALHGPARCGEIHHFPLKDEFGQVHGNLQMYAGPDSLVIIAAMARNTVLSVANMHIGTGSAPTLSGGTPHLGGYAIREEPGTNYWVQTYPLAAIGTACFTATAHFTASLQDWMGNTIRQFDMNLNTESMCIPTECCVHPQFLSA